MKKSYQVIKKEKDINDFVNNDYWKDVKQIVFNEDSYLWCNNNYKPKVIIKLFHSKNYIYLKFKVFEKKVTVKHFNFGSEVWKDSCVEFFINPFPQLSDKYFNIEINALGVPLIGVGTSDRTKKRYYFSEKELSTWTIVSSLKKPVNGIYGNDFWTLHYRIPKKFFENYYRKEFNIKKCIANFYKCGDETEYTHYGAWNRIATETPNFHLPEYFGELKFLESYK